MRAITEIGEALLCDCRAGGRDYLLRPSFEAIMSLGTPEEIVSLYGIVHRGEAYALVNRCQWLPDELAAYILRLPDRTRESLLTASMRVIEACCDDDLTELVGEWYGDPEGRVVYRPGQLSFDDIVLIAQSLLQHGITGKAQVRQLQRHQTNETATGFQALEYINAARTHLGINRDEAAALTMTEFQLLLAAKYPDQKGFTKEEYNEVRDDFLAKQAARRAAAA